MPQKRLRKRITNYQQVHHLQRVVNLIGDTMPNGADWDATCVNETDYQLRVRGSFFYRHERMSSFHVFDITILNDLHDDPIAIITITSATNNDHQTTTRFTLSADDNVIRDVISTTILSHDLAHQSLTTNNAQRFPIAVW